MAGDYENDQTIVRAESQPFLNGNRASIKIDTSVNCSKPTPMFFDMLAKRGDLASTSTLRIYFASTETLTDADVFADVIYQDATFENAFNIRSGAAQEVGANVLDPLAVGTGHSADGSSDWRDGAGDLVGFNEYFADLSLPNGILTVPYIRLYVTKPNITVYIDTTVDFV